MRKQITTLLSLFSCSLSQTLVCRFALRFRYAILSYFCSKIVESGQHYLGKVLGFLCLRTLRRNTSQQVTTPNSSQIIHKLKLPHIHNAFTSVTSVSRRPPPQSTNYKMLSHDVFFFVFEFEILILVSILVRKASASRPGNWK